MRFLVSQVKETVAWMMRMQSQLGAVLAEPTARAHHEGFAASVTELVLALRARKVHATTPTYTCIPITIIIIIIYEHINVI